MAPTSNIEDDSHHVESTDEETTTQIKQCNSIERKAIERSKSSITNIGRYQLNNRQNNATISVAPSSAPFRGKVERTRSVHVETKKPLLGDRPRIHSCDGSPNIPRRNVIRSRSTSNDRIILQPERVTSEKKRCDKLVQDVHDDDINDIEKHPKRLHQLKSTKSGMSTASATTKSNCIFSICSNKRDIIRTSIIFCLFMLPASLFVSNYHMIQDITWNDQSLMKLDESSIYFQKGSLATEHIKNTLHVTEIRNNSQLDIMSNNHEDAKRSVAEQANSVESSTNEISSSPEAMSANTALHSTNETNAPLVNRKALVETNPALISADETNGSLGKTKPQIEKNTALHSTNETNDLHGNTKPLVVTNTASNTNFTYNYTYWSLKPSGRFAYVYLVGGCDPAKPSYRNYLYDILVSTYNQRSDNSQADVIVLLQMKYQSKLNELPIEDTRLLDIMNIKYQYIPKSSTESFYKIMIDKFRILNLTQYERVFFMDSDVMALRSMDYIFEMSANGVLKENVVFAGVKEAANGGGFMLTPKVGSWERILEIIEKKEIRGKQLPYPHWDDVIGWGHAIDNTTDYYQFANGKKGYLWNYYGAFADQGLLYHWVKYEEKSVSIIMKTKIQHWGVGGNGVLRLQETHKIDLITTTPNSTANIIARKCWNEYMKQNPCVPPHSDYIHFTGSKKPWLKGPPKDSISTLADAASASDVTNVMMKSPTHYWFHVLSILNKDLAIGLDFTKWKTDQRPAFGLFPKHVDAAGTDYGKTVQVE